MLLVSRSVQCCLWSCINYNDVINNISCCWNVPHQQILLAGHNLLPNGNHVADLSSLIVQPLSNLLRNWIWHIPIRHNCFLCDPAQHTLWLESLANVVLCKLCWYDLWNGGCSTRHLFWLLGRTDISAELCKQHYAPMCNRRYILHFLHHDFWI